MHSEQLPNTNDSKSLSDNPTLSVKLLKKLYHQLHKHSMASKLKGKAMD